MTITVHVKPLEFVAFGFGYRLDVDTNSKGFGFERVWLDDTHELRAYRLFIPFIRLQLLHDLREQHPWYN